ncbi:hypothetical protein IB286_14245 [Spongiibacter sp. KMU-158]|uniref:Uncharacterized protein n=1 Tax=Spongiibacter pelagi TaxID=2760804 RepID=A0A927C2L9_9GAMM|nr:hypothetical protein [Spongiibacter pelagi]MBD2860159.1 hypothetical protein [Spongiibacter pelagi]
MSTKASIFYGERFHLYKEVADDFAVHLELTAEEYEVEPGRVRLRIPQSIWEVIRQHSEVTNYQWAEKSDIEIQDYVNERVAERIKAVEDAASDNEKSRIDLSGFWIFGAATDPMDEQVRNGTEYFKRLRDEEKKVLDAIEKAGTLTTLN